MFECIGTIRRNVDQNELGLEGDSQLNIEIFKLCIQKSKAPYFFENSSDLTDDEEAFTQLRTQIQQLILDVSFKEPNFEQIVEVLSQALQAQIENQCEDQALNIEAVLDVFSAFLSSFSQTHVSLVNNQERQLIQFFFSDVLKQTCASDSSHQMILKGYIDCLISLGRILLDPESKSILISGILEVFFQENCLRSPNVEIVIHYLRQFYNFFMRFKKQINMAILSDICLLFRDTILPQLGNETSTVTFQEQGAHVFKVLGEIAFFKDYPLENRIEVVNANLNWFYHAINKAKDSFDLKMLQTLRTCLRNYSRLYISWKQEEQISLAQYEFMTLLIKDFSDVSEALEGATGSDKDKLLLWKSESFKILNEFSNKGLFLMNDEHMEAASVAFIEAVLRLDLEIDHDSDISRGLKLLTKCANRSSVNFIKALQGSFPTLFLKTRQFLTQLDSCDQKQSFKFQAMAVIQDEFLTMTRKLQQANQGFFLELEQENEGFFVSFLMYLDETIIQAKSLRSHELAVEIVLHCFKEFSNFTDLNMLSADKSEIVNRTIQENEAFVSQWEALFSLVERLALDRWYDIELYNKEINSNLIQIYFDLLFVFCYINPDKIEVMRKHLKFEKKMNYGYIIDVRDGVKEACEAAFTANNNGEGFNSVSGLFQYRKRLMNAHSENQRKCFIEQVAYTPSVSI